MQKKYKKIKQTHRLKTLNQKIRKKDKVFKIKEFVMNMDLRELEKSLKPSKRGQKPIPLWIPVAVWMYAYSRGIQSYREVSRLCKSEDPFYWLSCGFEPSPGYFEQWKLRILPLIVGLAEGYRNYLFTNQLIENKVMGIDGVKVEVWASLKQSKTGKSIDKEIEKMNKMIKESNPSEQKRGLRRKKKLLARKEELQARKKAGDHLSEKQKEKMRINITSPSTVILHKRNGQVIQGTNVQCGINQDQIINVISPEAKSTDCGLLGVIYDKISAFLKVKILKVPLLLDSGYWEINDLIRFDPAKGYKIVMPSPKDVAESRKKRVGSLGKGGLRFEQGFKYDQKADVIICPMDKILNCQGKMTARKKHVQIRYRASQKDCSSCEMMSQCLGDVKSRVKQISRSKEVPEAGRMRAYYKRHQELYKQRGIINEPVHGQMFNNLGIVKMHCLSKSCMDGEVHLIALIHTLKKIEKKYGHILPIAVHGKVLLIFCFFSRGVNELKFTLILNCPVTKPVTSVETHGHASLQK